MISSPQAAHEALDELNNRITMGEAEVKRLTGLKYSIENDISALNKEHKYREGEIRSLTAQVSELATNINEYKKTISSAERVKAEQKKGWEELALAQAELENDSNAMLEKATAREDKLDERDSMLLDRERDFDARNAILYEKEDKLRKLLDDLKD